MNNLFELKNKVEIIPGGNGRIGFGMATGLVSAGAAIPVGRGYSALA